jgi:hypothetical protein
MGHGDGRVRSLSCKFVASESFVLKVVVILASASLVHVGMIFKLCHIEISNNSMSTFMYVSLTGNTFVYLLHPCCDRLSDDTNGMQAIFVLHAR